jgi:hypothetical protein
VYEEVREYEILAGWRWHEYEEMERVQERRVRESERERGEEEEGGG